jgi:nicotinate dehydrogenase subunit B
MPQEITLKVNGRTHRVSVEPDTPLLYVLRNDLGLKGTKFACGLEQCGACKIIIDGQAVASCRLPVQSVQDREITTIEGLGTAENLHPLQKAFIEEQAVQCGFCVSGMIIAAKALLDRNPCPTDADIQNDLSGNLCRCGTYERIRKAVKRAVGQGAIDRVGEKAEISDREFKPEPFSSAPAGDLPQPLVQTPDLDAWVRINRDNTITLFTGKVELGQDIRTSVAVIGAEELDVSLERIRVVMGDTAQTPNEGYTVSSMSLQTTGNAIRYAAAQVRQMALTAAREKLDAPPEHLAVTDGTITDPATGCSVTYWDLFGGKRFNCPVTGAHRPKRPEAYRMVGNDTERLDLLAKVTGGACFIHDLDLPGMVHGRVIRPPGYGARLVSVDKSAVSQVPGIIQVVRDGSFLAVLAEREEQAVKAMDLLKKASTWEAGKALPPQETLFDHLLSQPDQAFLVVDGTPADDPIPPIKAPAASEKTLAATYHRPYHMHASLGPSAAVAAWIDGRLTVWTHNQGVFPLRADLARVLGMAEEDVRAVHMDGPGCFGHNGADDAALDAALLARALPGRPVSVKWMRADENQWEPYGSPAVIKIQASLDPGGQVIDWNHDVWSYTHTNRARGVEGTSGLLAAGYLAEPLAMPKPRPNMGPMGGIHRNADPLYTFPRRRIVKHYLPDSPLRVSALRGLGSYANIFAIESFMDELALAAGADPVKFRLKYLKDERARAVIKAAAEKAGRQPEGQGRGIAFARYKNRQSYLAAVMDVRVNRDDGHISLERAVVAADAGQIVNPDALRNQLEGVVIQSSSWTLKEQVAFDPDGITSVDWDSYPIFRFIDAPKIETVLLNRPGRPYLGIGEGAQGPIPAAIANAVFDAVGIRLRQIPFTPERVKAACKESVD